MAGIKSCFRDGRHGELGGEEHVVESHGGRFVFEIFKGVEVTTVFPDKDNAGDTFVGIRCLRGNNGGEITGAGVLHLPKETAAAEKYIDVFCFNRPHEVIHAVIAGFEPYAGDVSSDPLRHLCEQPVFVGNMRCETVLPAKTHHAETNRSDSRSFRWHQCLFGV